MHLKIGWTDDGEGTKHEWGQRLSKCLGAE